jgi:hypothetical protein
MRIRLFLVGVAVALACAPGASAQWRHLSSARAVQAPHAAPLSPARALRRSEAAFGSRASGRRDLSPLLKRLAAALPRLHGAERRRAAGLLARPTEGAADPQQNGWSVPEAAASPLCSSHFCVHWVDSTADAPPLADGNGNGIPDWVETVSGVAEHVYSVENDQLGWRPPKSDGSEGGANGKTDIYLANIGGTGVYGYTAVDPEQEVPANQSLYSYLVLDNDFSPAEFAGYASPLEPLEVTQAHEYNHVLQYTYDGFESTWMEESTAVWMESKVYPAVHDYLQYLPRWVTLSLQPVTLFITDPSDPASTHVYGTSVWNKWLEARHGEQTVRAAWEDSIGVKPASFAPAAYDASIRAHGGKGFSDEFDRFAAATAEWRAQGSGFPEGALYPDMKRAGSLTVNGTPGFITLDHTAFALVNVTGSTAARTKLSVKVPAGTKAGLALVGRSDGAAHVLVRALPKGGRGSVTLPAGSSFDRLTAVLVNSDPSNRGFARDLDDWEYKKDGQRFDAAVSTDFSRPRVSGRSPRPGSRVGARKNVTVRFSEGVVGVTRSSFELIGPGGHRVSAQLAFKQGARKATLAPPDPLKRGKRYRVRLTSAISDRGLNALRAPSAWRFSVR